MNLPKKLQKSWILSWQKVLNKLVPFRLFLISAVVLLLFITLSQNSFCQVDEVLKGYLDLNRSGQFDDIRPLWSPDGLLLAFERKQKGQESSAQEIHCLKRIGKSLVTAQVTITQPPPGRSSFSLGRYFEEEDTENGVQRQGYAGDFCWAGNLPTPQGKYQFVFTQGVNLYVGAIDANLNRPTVSPFVKLFSEGGKPIVNTDADWGPQNLIAFFSGFSGNGDIYLKAPNRTDAIELPGERLTPNEGLDLFPKWSPDGMTLVYSSVRKKENGSEDADIYLIDNVLHAKKRTEKQLTDTQEDYKNSSWAQEQSTDELSPNWSPDGKMIVFYRLQQPKPTKTAKNYELWVMNHKTKSLVNEVNRDGTQKQRIATSVYREWSGPTWLPKEFGHKLIYISENQDSLHIWDVTSQGEVTPHELNDSDEIARRGVSHRVMSDLSCAPHRKGDENPMRRESLVWIAYSAVDKEASGRKRIYWEAFKMPLAGEKQ